MTAVLPLPARLDLPAAAPLARSLLSLRGAALTIRADAVTHLGTPCLQVLLSAGKSWRADGLALTIDAPSAAFRDQLGIFGLGLAELQAPAEH